MTPALGARNPRIVETARLHRTAERRRRGQTLIEGPHLLYEAVATGAEVTAVFALEGDAASRARCAELGLTPTIVTEGALTRISDTDTPRGPVANHEIPDQTLPRDRPVLVAWGISDPGNMGTLIRTAAGFGWSVGHTTGTTDPWSPKALRSGAGGHFRTIVAPVSGVEDLVSWTIVASVPRGGEAPEPVPGERVALLIGDEAAGLPADVIEHCQKKVSIAMPGGIESLNAGVAAGILVYELSRGDR